MKGLIFDMLQIVLWSSIGLLLYIYIGYPIGIALAAHFRLVRVERGEALPSVSVLLAVWNGAELVAGRIENLLAMDYPQEKLDIVVVDDGSTDETVEVASRFEERGVRVVPLQQHAGKAAALNAGLDLTDSELVLFCDARQTAHRGALKELVACLEDDKVGAASGILSMAGAKGPGMYWRYEKWIRRSESRVASLVGVTGAFWAAKRHLLAALPPETVLDDVYQPMRIAMAGFRVVLAEEAHVFDAETEIHSEFKRKVRTLAGNYQLIKLLPGLLNPRRNPLFTQFISHKMLRLFSPFLLASTAVSNLLLVWLVTPVSVSLTLLAVSQLLFYGMALWGTARKSRAGRLSRFAATFMIMNAAAAVGLKCYLFKQDVWGGGDTAGRS